MAGRQSWLCLSVLVASVSSCSSGPSGPPDAVAACERHFDTVKVAEWTTVGGVRYIGPVNRGEQPPSPLDKYPNQERAVLCLVPKNGEFAAEAVIIRTGEVVGRWLQNLDDEFTRPI
jgi:hypothetical protein